MQQPTTAIWRMKNTQNIMYLKVLVTQFSVTLDTVSDSWHCRLASFTLTWYTVCVWIMGNLWQLLSLHILEVFPTKLANFNTSCNQGVRDSLLQWNENPWKKSSLPYWEGSESEIIASQVPTDLALLSNIFSCSHWGWNKWRSRTFLAFI